MNPKYKNPISNMRVNINCGVYTSIALRNYLEAAEHITHLQEESITISYCQEESEIANEKLITCEVFAALAIESFLNDYAAKHLGDKLFYENFDTLPVLSKLQFISLLFFEKEFPKDSNLFALLKSTFKTRNEYAHNKSIDGSKYCMTKEEYEAYQKEKPEEPICYQEHINFYIEELQQEEKQAYISLRAIAAIVNYFDQCDENAYAKSYFFRSNEYMPPENDLEKKKAELIQQLLREKA